MDFVTDLRLFVFTVTRDSKQYLLLFYCVCFFFFLKPLHYTSINNSDLQKQNWLLSQKTIKMSICLGVSDKNPKKHESLNLNPLLVWWHEQMTRAASLAAVSVIGGCAVRAPGRPAPQHSLRYVASAVSLSAMNCPHSLALTRLLVTFTDKPSL